jgi:hypothetical protein
MDEQSLQALLDAAIRPYLKKGWMIQSSTPTRAQLIYTKQHGCLWKLTFGLFAWWLFPSKSIVLNFEVAPDGKIRTFKVKR